MEKTAKLENLKITLENQDGQKVTISISDEGDGHKMSFNFGEGGSKDIKGILNYYSAVIFEAITKG